MKKLLAIMVSVVMIFAMAATVFAAPAEVTWEDYQQYLMDTAGKNAPNKAEFTEGRDSKRTIKKDIVVPDADDSAKDYDYDNPENN